MLCLSTALLRTINHSFTIGLNGYKIRTMQLRKHHPVLGLLWTCDLDYKFSFSRQTPLRLTHVVTAAMFQPIIRKKIEKKRKASGVIICSDGIVYGACHEPALVGRPGVGPDHAGPIRCFFMRWAAARPGTSIFQIMGRGLAQPIALSNLHGPARPGPTINY